MNFKIYLIKRRMTIKKFAESIDMNPSYMAGIISGRIKPGKKTARIIHRATEGEISYDDLMSGNI